MGWVFNGVSITQNNYNANHNNGHVLCLAISGQMLPDVGDNECGYSDNGNGSAIDDNCGKMSDQQWLHVHSFGTHI